MQQQALPIKEDALLNNYNKPIKNYNKDEKSRKKSVLKS